MSHLIEAMLENSAKTAKTLRQSHTASSKRYECLLIGILMALLTLVAESRWSKDDQ